MPTKKKRTRRRPGEGSFHKRANGSIEYRVPVGSAQNKVIKSFYGQTEQEAKDKYEIWKAEHPNGLPTIDQRKPLNDLIAVWLQTKIKPPAGAASTYNNYNGLIKRHIVTRIGLIPVCELKLSAINDFLNERFTSTGHGRTVEKVRNILRAALAYAVQNGVIEHNPAEHATVPTFQRRKAQAFTLVQCRALVEAASGRLDVRKPYKTSRTPDSGAGKKWPPVNPRLLALYLLALVAGLRKGELLGLQWGDLNGSQLTIRRIVDDYGKLQDRTKTEASAVTISLDDEMIAALAEHRRLMQAERHQEGWKPDGLMFPTTNGTVLMQRSLDRHFKTLLEAAGLPVIRFHDLRHSAGTLMIESGANLPGVSKAMRHANASITAQIYLHGSDEGAMRAIAGVSRLLLSPKDDTAR
jgi:integrase